MTPTSISRRGLPGAPANLPDLRLFKNASIDSNWRPS
jgi:hypothetical protein